MPARWQHAPLYEAWAQLENLVARQETGAEGGWTAEALALGARAGPGVAGRIRAGSRMGRWHAARLADAVRHQLPPQPGQQAEGSRVSRTSSFHP